MASSRTPWASAISRAASSSSSRTAKCSRRRATATPTSQRKRPVDPERTLFRAGSVAKLVTHTAVMQLVEQGKLDLDADIAKYLDFPVPDAMRSASRSRCTTS